MSKKNFIALADTLKDSLQSALRFHVIGTTNQDEAFRVTIETLATFCASQNPKFDRARWLGYIASENGPNGGTAKRIGHKIAMHVIETERTERAR